MAPPVIIFGAGATKACEGPLTNEILFETFKKKHANADPARFDFGGFLDN